MCFIKFPNKFSILKQSNCLYVATVLMKRIICESVVPDAPSIRKQKHQNVNKETAQKAVIAREETREL